MASIDQAPVRFRCPVCFSRETDVVLCQKGADYYCVKCSFTGNRADIWSMYGDLQRKYQWMLNRVTLEQQDEL
jgi:transcription elongation factor Elf1